MATAKTRRSRRSGSRRWSPGAGAGPPSGVDAGDHLGVWWAGCPRPVRGRQGREQPVPIVALEGVLPQHLSRRDRQRRQHPGRRRHPGLAHLADTPGRGRCAARCRAEGSARSPARRRRGSSPWAAAPPRRSAASPGNPAGRYRRRDPRTTGCAPPSRAAGSGAPADRRSGRISSTRATKAPAGWRHPGVRAPSAVGPGSGGTGSGRPGEPAPGRVEAGLAPGHRPGGRTEVGRAPLGGLGVDGRRDLRGEPFGVAAVAPQRLRRSGAVQQVAAKQFGRGDVAVTEGDRRSAQSRLGYRRPSARSRSASVIRPAWYMPRKASSGRVPLVPYRSPARRRACSKGSASKPAERVDRDERLQG